MLLSFAGCSKTETSSFNTVLSINRLEIVRYPDEFLQHVDMLIYCIKCFEVSYYLGITNTKNSKFRFSIQKLHHCIRESVLSTMQKIFMNTPNTFPVMKENICPCLWF